jgi:flagellar biogenesis protein FliO
MNLMDVTTVVIIVIALVLVIWGFTKLINKQNPPKKKHKAGNQKK